MCELEVQGSKVPTHGLPNASTLIDYTKAKLEREGTQICTANRQQTDGRHTFKTEKDGT